MVDAAFTPPLTPYERRRLEGDRLWAFATATRILFALENESTYVDSDEVELTALISALSQRDRTIIDELERAVGLK